MVSFTGIEDSQVSHSQLESPDTVQEHSAKALSKLSLCTPLSAGAWKSISWSMRPARLFHFPRMRLFSCFRIRRKWIGVALE
jgi:hypothetical protein